MVDPGFDIDPEFEQHLRDSLRTRPAPEGFAERVLGRLPQSMPAPQSPARRRLLTFSAAARLAAAATMLVAVLVSGILYQHQRQVAGEHARKQVLLALRITGATLQQVEQKINQNGKESQP